MTPVEARSTRTLTPPKGRSLYWSLPLRENAFQVR